MEQAKDVWNLSLIHICASRKLIRRLARIDVLLVDELAYLNLRPEQTNIVFKLMEERYRRKATLITTNLLSLIHI